jgi:hypothetical protein
MLQRKLIAAACFALLASNAYAAKLYISEYNSLTLTAGLIAQAAPEASTDQTPVDYSGGVASSAAFASATSYVRVICDTQCSIKFGTAPTATNANKVLPALTPEYFGVPQGSAYKISVIANP